jgi:hypothetical protein
MYKIKILKSTSKEDDKLEIIFNLFLDLDLYGLYKTDNFY